MNVILRPWRPEDAADIAPLANNKAVADNLRDIFPYPYTLQNAQDFVAMCMKEDGNGQLLRTIEVDGHAVGSIAVSMGTDVYRKSAELGYWLGEPYWRKGIMSCAVRKICTEAFKTLDIVRIHAEPYAYNRGSRGVLEKAGFQLEGIMKNSVFKNGKIFDSCIYALLKEEMQK